ncbi:MAG: DNA polymerase, partial [Candidatus Paceibacterota bacterium]
ELKHGASEYVSFDTETTGLGRSAQVFGFSIGFGSRKDKTAIGNVYWYRFSDYCFNPIPEELDTQAIEVIKYLFTKTDKRIIMHGGKFDIRVVKQTFDIDFTVPNFNDTMLMSECQQTSIAHDLKRLASKHLQDSNPWDVMITEWFTSNKITAEERDYGLLPDEIIFPYACKDAQHTYMLFFKLLDLFKTMPKEIQTIYLMERELTRIVAEIEYNGMIVDKFYFAELQTKITEIVTKLNKEFKELWGKDFNINSSQQLAEVVFGTGQNCLGLKATEFTEKTKIPKTGVPILVKFSDNPVVQKIITFSHLDHLLNNFISPILNNSFDHKDGTFTIHTSYNQIITTGRFSSEKINLQNIPNDSFSRTHGMIDEQIVSIRKGFICPEDYIYIKVDYSAFELRIIGNISQDKKFIQMILDGVDMHSWLAAKLYSDELEELENSNKLQETFNPDTKDKELSKKWDLDWKYWAIKSKSTPDFKYMRTMVKICSFQIYYGSGAKTISDMHGISIGGAQKLKYICFSTFNTIEKWCDQVRSATYKTGVVKTFFGRRCVPKPQKIYTESVNYTIQGTAADLLKMAMLEVGQFLRGKKSRLIATIHDEIQMYIHKSEISIIPQIVAIMEKRRAPEDVFPLPMEVELSVSETNWFDMRDVPRDKIKEMCKCES